MRVKENALNYSRPNFRVIRSPPLTESSRTGENPEKKYFGKMIIKFENISCNNQKFEPSYKKSGLQHFQSCCEIVAAAHKNVWQ